MVDAWVHAIFHYNPSVAALWTAYFAFLLMVCWSLLLTVRRSPRAWIMYLVPFAAFLEMTGYGTRDGTLENKTLMWFMMSTLCLIVPPIFLAAVNYSVAGKLVHGLAAHQAAQAAAAQTTSATVAATPASSRVLCCSSRHLGRLFLAGDIFCFILQCSGAYPMMNKDPNVQMIGKATNVLGIVLQLCLFGLYTWLLVSLKRSAKFAALPTVFPNFSAIFRGLCLTMGCLWLRNIFRLWEFLSYFEANGGYVNSVEWPLYVFDALPIFVALVFYCTHHFGGLLRPASELAASSAASDFLCFRSASKDVAAAPLSPRPSIEAAPDAIVRVEPAASRGVYGSATATAPTGVKLGALSMERT